MPLPGLVEIQTRRIRLGLTQSGLATLSDISRSSLTKIELAYRELEQGKRANYVPNYEDAKRIFEALEREETQLLKGILSERVGRVAHSPVARVSPNDKVSIAKRLMKKFDYSQLPVLDGRACVGRVTDSVVVGAIEKCRSLEEAYQSDVRSIMGDPLPVVSENTLLGSVVLLLREQRAILVSKNGNIGGIVTAFDVMI